MLTMFCANRGGHQPFDGKIKSITGAVKIFKQKKPGWEELKVSSILDFGDTISTESESEVEVCFNGDNSIKIGESTKIAVAMVADSGDKEPHTLEVYTAYGSVLSNIEKLTGRYKGYHVRTPTATAAIRGTFFFVFFHPVKRVTHVNVLKGRVFVRNPYIFAPVPVIVMPGFFTFIAMHNGPVMPKKLNYGQWKKMHRLLPPPLHNKYFKKFKIKQLQKHAGPGKMKKKALLPPGPKPLIAPLKPGGIKPGPVKKVLKKERQNDNVNSKSTVKKVKKNK